MGRTRMKEKMNSTCRQCALSAATVSLAVAAVAADYTLEQSGSWTAPVTWGLSSGYPNAADANVLFDDAGTRTVSLDSGSPVTVNSIWAKKGTTTVGQTEEGSVLQIEASDYIGLKVDAGATLCLETPIETTKRVDRHYPGTIRFRSTYSNVTELAYGYISCCGTNYLEGAAEFHLPNAPLYLGMSENYGRKNVWPFFVKDRAKLTVKSISFAAGVTVPDCQIVQDGPETSVAVAGNLDLNSAVRDLNDHAYVLKSGTLAVGGRVRVHGSKDPTSASAPSNMTYYADSRKPHFIIEGGTATVYNVELMTGSAVLRGGRLNVTRSSSKVTDLISAASGTALEISGGTLGWPMAFNPCDLPAIVWCGDATVASAGDFSWDWSKAAVEPGASLTYDGTGVLSFFHRVSTYGVAMGLAAGRKAKVSGNSTVVNPSGSYAPWRISLADGSVFELADMSARVSAPVELSVEGTGKVLCSGHARNYLVAHKLTVGGVLMPKGRYCAKDTSWLDCSAANALVAVPYVWTGDGDGTSWADAGNWDGAVVPPSGADVCVDLSRATEIVNDADRSVGLIVAMPNAGSRKVTVSGAGKITLGTATEYDPILIVKDDSELVFDAPVVRAAKGEFLLLGGGTVTYNKSAFGISQNSLSYMALAGTWRLNDVTALNNFESVTTANIAFHTADGVSKGVVMVGGDSNLSFNQLVLSPSGYTPIDEFRQTGGTIAANAVYIGRYNFSDHRPLYLLEDGALTVGSGGLCLGDNYSSNWTRYPGGSFEMAGGLLTVPKIETYRNQNYVTAYGGTIAFTSNNGLKQSSVSGQEATQNAYGYYLGGVALKGTVVGTVKSCATIPEGTKVWLTGRNGDLRVDCSEYYAYFHKNAELAGPGGIRSFGTAGDFTIRSKCYFTGDLTVESGKTVIENNGAFELNGPRALRVLGGSLRFANTVTSAQITKHPEIIELVSTSSLNLQSASLTLTVKRLVVGGTVQAKGTYTFGTGKVVVEEAPASWLTGTKGDLSFTDSGSGVSLTADTTLDSLVYRANNGVVSVNPSGSEKLVFNDGATIEVSNGSTVEINADVVLGGKVAVIGMGTVKFNGAVTCPATVEKGASDSDVYWLTVKHGQAEFDGAVTGVRLITCSGDGDVPVIVLKSNCTVSDYAAVLTAYTSDKSVSNCRGETRQEGATVDYTTVPVAWSSLSTGIPLSKMNGGFGRYVLNSGTFGYAERAILFVQDWDDHGAFEFVQNGGTVKMSRLFFARDTNGQTFSYVMNDGAIEVKNGFYGYDCTMGTLALNGGKIVFAGSTRAICGSDLTVRLGDGANVVMATAEASNAPLLDVDLVGNGAAIDFQGPGSISLCGYCLDALTVTGGHVVLRDSTVASLSPSLAISLAKDAILGLDFRGTVPVGTVRGDGVLWPANRDYGTGARAKYAQYFSGDGSVRPASGSPLPGVMIFIR